MDSWEGSPEVSVLLRFTCKPQCQGSVTFAVCRRHMACGGGASAPARPPCMSAGMTAGVAASYAPMHASALQQAGSHRSLCTMLACLSAQGWSDIVWQLAGHCLPMHWDSFGLTQLVPDLGCHRQNFK